MKLSSEQKAALKKLAESIHHETEHLDAIEKALIVVEALRDLHGEKWVIVADMKGFNVKKD